MPWGARGLRAEPRRRRGEMDGGAVGMWGGVQAVLWRRPRAFVPCDPVGGNFCTGTCGRSLWCVPVWRLPACLLVTEPTFCSWNRPSPSPGPHILVHDSTPSPRWLYDSGLRESAYPLLFGHSDWSKNQLVTQISSMRSTFWTSSEWLRKSFSPYWMWGCKDVSKSEVATKPHTAERRGDNVPWLTPPEPLEPAVPDVLSTVQLGEPVGHNLFPGRQTLRQILGIGCLLRSVLGTLLRKEREQRWELKPNAVLTTASAKPRMRPRWRWPRHL